MVATGGHSIVFIVILVVFGDAIELEIISIHMVISVIYFVTHHLTLTKNGTAISKMDITAAERGVSV